MFKEVKEEWLKRLRSGDIPQGAGALGTPSGKRCCLGVLCDIAVEQNVIREPQIETAMRNDGREEGPLVYGGWDVDTLPLKVMQWAGLGDSNPTVSLPYDDERQLKWTSLAELNDRGTSFSEIADIIEHEL